MDKDNSFSRKAVARQNKIVVVFGIFDGVHDGHRDLFKQARELGDNLTVIVGRDSIAEQLKGRKPKHAEDERVEVLKTEPLVNNVLLGDRELSTYSVLVQCNPDAICLGYDQQELQEDLQKWMVQAGKNIELYRAKSYQNGALHSSNL